MNMKEFIEQATAEQKQKMLQCKSTEELLQLAKDEGIDIAAEDAATFLTAVGENAAEISDDDLAKVAGGLWYTTQKGKEAQDDGERPSVASVINVAKTPKIKPGN